MICIWNEIQCPLLLILTFCDNTFPRPRLLVPGPTSQYTCTTYHSSQWYIKHLQRSVQLTINRTYHRHPSLVELSQRETGAALHSESQQSAGWSWNGTEHWLLLDVAALKSLQQLSENRIERISLVF